MVVVVGNEMINNLALVHLITSPSSHPSPSHSLKSNSTIGSPSTTITSTFLSTIIFTLTNPLII